MKFIKSFKSSPRFTFVVLEDDKGNKITKRFPFSPNVASLKKSNNWK